MRVVIQRVSEASVSINGTKQSEISTGLLLLLGIENNDDEGDIAWLCKKIGNLRIFPDSSGIMNRSIVDVTGEFLVVSQFTLHASTKKGNRPSYIRAAKPDIAIPIYDSFVRFLSQSTGRPVKTGLFGANMKVSLINDGPVTIIIDSKIRE